MLLDPNIEQIFFYNLSEPSFIVDADFKFRKLNEAAKELITGINEGENFLGYFSGSSVQLLERLLLESKNFLKTVTEEAEITFRNTNNLVHSKVIITPISVDNSQIFIITFSLLKVKSISEKTSSQLKMTGSIELESLANKEILEIVADIKASFPFTLVDKKRIRKKIDELKCPFWIKMPDAKYVIVNKLFASVFNLKQEQLENKSETEFLPAYLSQFYTAINSYIKETSQGIRYNGIGSLEKQFGEKVMITEIPLLDLNKEVIGMIGFAKPETELFASSQPPDKEITLLTQLNIPYIVINNELSIVTVSKKYSDTFELDQSQKFEGTDLKQITDSDLFKKIKLHIENRKYDVDIWHTFSVNDKLKKMRIKITENADSERKNQYILTFMEINDLSSKKTSKENMYELLMKNTLEAVFLYEVENLKFLDVNDAALKLYGYKRDEFLQMDLTDLYAPEDIQTLLESSNKKSKEGEFTGPWRHKKKDGTSVLVEISKVSTTYDNKACQLNVIRDVTKNVENKKELNIYKILFDNTSDSVMFTDKDGFITYCNKSVTDNFGFIFEDLKERPFLSLLSDGDRAKINTNVFHSDAKETQQFVINMKNVKGDLSEVNLVSTPHAGFNNEIESFSLILKKVKSAEENSMRHLTKSEISTGKLDPSFLSNLFHELLTPINVIVGFTQELMESIPNPSDDQKEAASIISENQKVLLQTMDTAVEYSHMEQNEIHISSDEINFVELLPNIEESIKKTLEAKNVEFDYSKISSSLTFHSDKQRFLTLVSLFLKFSIQMTKEKKIYLSAYPRNEKEFIISVKDSKSRVSAGLLKNLRELFTVDESIIRHAFGISRFTIRLARKLVEILAEQIEVFQKDNEATEYAIIFPVNLEVESKAKNLGKTVSLVEKETRESGKVKEQKEVVQKEKSVPAVKTAKGKSEPVQPHPVQDTKVEKLEDLDLTELNCLCVEDQVDSQILFKVQMKDLKSVEFCASFEEAIPLLKSKSFNFIVMDINLQGEYNGLDALHILRKMPAYQDVPVIAVSAYVLPGDKAKFIAAGFNDFISKPVLHDKLVDSLKRIFA